MASKTPTFRNKIKIYSNKTVFNFHLPNHHLIQRLNTQRQLLLFTGQTSKQLYMTLLPNTGKEQKPTEHYTTFPSSNNEITSI